MHSAVSFLLGTEVRLSTHFERVDVSTFSGPCFLNPTQSGLIKRYLNHLIRGIKKSLNYTLKGKTKSLCPQTFLGQPHTIQTI